MNRERDEDSEKVELQAKNNIISKWALIQLKCLLTEWMGGWMDGWMDGPGMLDAALLLVLA